MIRAGPAGGDAGPAGAHCCPGRIPRRPRFSRRIVRGRPAGDQVHSRSGPRVARAPPLPSSAGPGAAAGGAPSDPQLAPGAGPAPGASCRGIRRSRCRRGRDAAGAGRRASAGPTPQESGRAWEAAARPAGRHGGPARRISAFGAWRGRRRAPPPSAPLLGRRRRPPRARQPPPVHGCCCTAAPSRALADRLPAAAVPVAGGRTRTRARARAAARAPCRCCRCDRERSLAGCSLRRHSVRHGAAADAAASAESLVRMQRRALYCGCSGAHCVADSAASTRISVAKAGGRCKQRQGRNASPGP